MFNEFRFYRFWNKHFIEIKNDGWNSVNKWTDSFQISDLTFVATDFKILFLQCKTRTVQITAKYFKNQNI